VSHQCCCWVLLLLLLRAGAKTQLAGFITSMVVMFVLLFLTKVFELLPYNTMAAIIISGVMGLVEFDTAIYLMKVRGGGGAAAGTMQSSRSELGITPQTHYGSSGAAGRSQQCHNKTAAASSGCDIVVLSGKCTAGNCVLLDAGVAAVMVTAADSCPCHTPALGAWHIWLLDCVPALHWNIQLFACSPPIVHFPQLPCDE
jgi:hypothetical protein